MDAPPAVELVWTRGPGADACIGAQELAAKTEATLGRPVSLSDATSTDGGVVHLSGDVEPLASGWLAVVEVRAAGPALRREVTLGVPDCRQMDEAIVLVVALMAEAVLPVAPRLTLPVHRPSVSVAIGPDVALAWGMLPGVVAGFGLASDVAIPPLWRLAHFSAWAHVWPVSQALDEGSGGRLGAWTFGAGPCVGGSGHERISLSGCAGVSGGVVYASGVGLEASHSRTLPYWQGEARIGLRLRIAGPAVARLELGVGVPFARDSYRFIGANGVPREVFRTAAVVPLGRLAIEFRAP